MSIEIVNDVRKREFGLEDFRFQRGYCIALAALQFEHITFQCLDCDIHSIKRFLFCLFFLFFWMNFLFLNE